MSEFWTEMLILVGVILNAIRAHYLGKRLDHVDKAVNGRLTQLLNLTAKASKAEGVKEASSDNPASQKPPLP